jgi:hypothetical protein
VPDGALDEECAFTDSNLLTSETGGWLGQQGAYSEVGLHTCNCRPRLTLTRHRAATLDTSNIKAPPTKLGHKHHCTLSAPSSTLPTALLIPSTLPALQSVVSLPIPSRRSIASTVCPISASPPNPCPYRSLATHRMRLLHKRKSTSLST